MKDENIPAIKLTKPGDNLIGDKETSENLILTLTYDASGK